VTAKNPSIESVYERQFKTLKLFLLVKIIERRQAIAAVKKQPAVVCV
jgi:hypothetical protein